MENDKEANCLVLLDKFYSCCGVSHQFGSVYRKSEFDNCGYSFDNFKNCIMAKTVSDEGKRQRYLEKSIPTPEFENKVWKLKEQGSWNTC